jgi:hypothetical protein
MFVRVKLINLTAKNELDMAQNIFLNLFASIYIALLKISQKWNTFAENCSIISNRYTFLFQNYSTKFLKFQKLSKQFLIMLLILINPINLRAFSSHHFGKAKYNTWKIH